MASKPAAMCEQIEGGHALRRHRILEPKVGEILSNRGLPIQLALVRQHGHGRGCECLAARADGKDRLWRDRGAPLHIAESVALDMHHLAVLDDQGRHARDLPVPHGRFQELIETFERALCAGPLVHSLHLPPPALGANTPNAPSWYRAGACPVSEKMTRSRAPSWNTDPCTSLLPWLRFARLERPMRPL